MGDFLEDTWSGLSAKEKHLDSKYFYDQAGDAIFREIMDCPEYYLTRCELEIFTTNAGSLSAEILHLFGECDLVELGPGDASKSVFLLNALSDAHARYTYFPIDISGNVIGNLGSELPRKIPGLNIVGLHGEFFEMLAQMPRISVRPKVILFLGSNVGNIPAGQTFGFFNELRRYMQTGDLLLTGFDLKKDPAIILDAYNDRAGITAKFNLNLLSRINSELHADFDLTGFEHSPVYDEVSGECRSYLVSMAACEVNIPGKGTIHFAQGERIFMEVSRKYSIGDIETIARNCRFSPVRNYFDPKNWFVDALWMAS